jgi:hypothetical protein
MGQRSKISRSDYATLRASFDGSEPIMTGGFGVFATRQPARAYQTPDWMNNDLEVAEFIHRIFPRAGQFGCKCQCDPCTLPDHRLDRSHCRCHYCRDTMRAARWAVVIYRWFRLRHTDIKIELDHHWKPGTVGSIVQKIRRRINGKRQDGIPRTGRPRGRPRQLLSKAA